MNRGPPATELGQVAAALRDVDLAWVLFGTLVLAALARLGVDLWHGVVGKTDELAGANFELKLASLFQDLGYEVKLVASNRGDLVVEKDGRRAVVQATSPGLAGVSRAAVARGFYGADEAIVVSSRFRAAARKQAARKHVELWDGEMLAELRKTDTA
jgi:HJR/Mrr/RecB family endonuclease